MDFTSSQLGVDRVSDHPRGSESRAKVSLSRTRLCEPQVWPSRRFGLRLSVRVFHKRSEIIADYPDIGMIRPKSSSRSNLAGLLTETNRHAEAEPLYHGALAISKC